MPNIAPPQSEVLRLHAALLASSSRSKDRRLPARFYSVCNVSMETITNWGLRRLLEANASRSHGGLCTFAARRNGAGLLLSDVGRSLLRHHHVLQLGKHGFGLSQRQAKGVGRQRRSLQADDLVHCETII